MTKNKKPPKRVSKYDQDVSIPTTPHKLVKSVVKGRMSRQKPTKK